jgi:hypothetical protein
MCFSGAVVRLYHYLVVKVACKLRALSDVGTSMEYSPKTKFAGNKEEKSQVDKHT